MKRTFIFSMLTLAFMMICQSAFAYDYYVNGIYYRKVTQQLPGGACWGPRAPGSIPMTGA